MDLLRIRRNLLNLSELDHPKLFRVAKQLGMIRSREIRAERTESMTDDTCRILRSEVFKQERVS